MLFSAVSMLKSGIQRRVGRRRLVRDIFSDWPKLKTEERMRRLAEDIFEDYLSSLDAADEDDPDALMNYAEEVAAAAEWLGVDCSYYWESAEQRAQELRVKQESEDKMYDWPEDYFRPTIRRDATFSEERTPLASLFLALIDQSSTN